MTSIESAITEAIGGIQGTEAEGDWRDETGTLICGNCGQAKEATIELFGRKTSVPCMCQCQSEEYERKRQEFAESQRRRRIDRLRTTGIQDVGLRDCRFENAEMNPQMDRCKYYADHFDEFRKENIGMVFCGPVGNGKTYAAACIANALIDRGIPVLITSLPRIINTPKNELNEIIRDAKSFDLVVVDDFGTERQTEFALETATYFFDERYKSGKPTIITTNLSRKDLENPASKDYERIFSRILAMCLPMGFPKRDRRAEIADEKRSIAKELMNKLRDE